MEGKGLKSVIMCVLLVAAGSLGSLPQAAAANNRFHCRDRDASNCYFDCVGKYSRLYCMGHCGCEYERRSNLLTNKGDLANEYCKLGCRSSVCHSMSANADGSGPTRAAVERCGDACGRLCDEHAGDGASAIASVAA